MDLLVVAALVALGVLVLFSMLALLVVVSAFLAVLAGAGIILAHAGRMFIHANGRMNGLASWPEENRL